MKNLLAFTFLLCIISACNTTKNCVEHPKPDCMCTMQYDPVCGCNNKTYGNACAAECAGIKTYTKGECKQKTSVVLEGNNWLLNRVTGIPEPQQVPSNVPATVKFEAGKIQGNGGCNNIGGAYILNGDKLTINNLFSTKMYCAGASKWEGLMLERLEKSQSYRINGEELEIDCGPKGNLIFRLK